MIINENGEEQMHEEVDTENQGTEEMQEKNEEIMEKKPHNKSFTLMVGILLVGFIFGSLFGNYVDLFAWVGSEPENGGQISGGEMSFEEVRPQLEQALIQEKERELVMQHLDDLVVASNIETKLDDVGAADEIAVVATVNGEEIMMGELLGMEEQEKQQFAMMGLDPASEEASQMIEEMRPQILDNLIANAVLMQKIEEEGITVSEAKVEEYYQEYAVQFGGEESLEQQLQQAGMTKEDLKRDLAEQLPIQTYIENYLAENLNEDELNFSDEELRERYEQQMQQQQQQLIQ